MDFENFKEQFTEDIGNALSERGIDAAVTTNTVEKMNESYEALTITPEGSHVGLNLNMDRFFEAYENGIPYDEVVNKATDVAEQGIKESPAVDIASLTNYDIMKEKLAMEVVSIETNADLLNKIPHQQIEDMAVIYRCVLTSGEEGMSSVVVTNAMLNTFGVTAEQLHADAMENAPEIKPAVIKGMTEVMQEMMGDDFASMLDGNKRIGTHVMLVFFALNGIELRYTQKELYEMVLAVADGSLEYEDMLKWILEHQA